MDSKIVYCVKKNRQPDTVKCTGFFYLKISVKNKKMNNQYFTEKPLLREVVNTNLPRDEP